MKDFDARWKTVADRAAGARARDEQVPVGFTTRVVARHFQPTTASRDFTWDRLVARFLVGATVALLLCAAAEWGDARETRALEPGIENAVAQLVWKL